VVATTSAVLVVGLSIPATPQPNSQNETHPAKFCHLTTVNYSVIIRRGCYTQLAAASTISRHAQIQPSNSPVSVTNSQISNRDYIALFQFFPFRPAFPCSQKSCLFLRCLPGIAGLPTGASAVAVGRAFRTAVLPPVEDIPAGSFAVSPLITHHSPARQPCSGSLISAFLIYGPAIRNPRKP
jgi:hypothetical protein